MIFHQLSDEQKQDFVMKIGRTLVMIPGNYVILLQVMRHGFTHR